MKDFNKELKEWYAEWETDTDEAKILQWTADEIEILKERLYKKDIVINSALCKIEEDFKEEARFIHGILLEALVK